MFWKTLKFTLRVLLKNRFYTLLNLLGLAVGMCCSVIILLYLQNELTYDEHYPNHEQIYRVSSMFNIEGKPDDFAVSSAGIGPLLKMEWPEIEAFTRIGNVGKVLFEYEEKAIYESRFFWTDSTYFDIFEHPFLYGDAATCLKGPNSLVLTESTAKRYFGDTHPIGQVLGTQQRDYTVTGIIEDLPENTHFKFDGLIAVSTFTQGQPAPTAERFAQMLWNMSVCTYIRLPKEHRIENLNERFPEFYEKYMARLGEQLNGSFHPVFEQLAPIHLHSTFKWDSPQGNLSYIYAFSTIGIFILLLVCINYINLATARSANRAREIGLRKVMGGRKEQLVVQFLGESLVLALVALLIGLAMAEVILLATPFNELINKNLSLDFSNNPLLFPGVLSITLFLGLGSGLYPAFFLSGILPIRALKGAFKNSIQGLWMRKSLVTFQFAISIGVVICTLLMSAQMDFIKTKNLGFDRNNLLLIPIQDTLIRDQIPEIITELERNPTILAATTANMIPGTTMARNVWHIEGQDGMESQVFNFMSVGFEYFSTMGIEMTEGRDFDPDRSADLSGAFIVNQATVATMGWDDALGKKIAWQYDESGVPQVEGKVVGVVNNFNSADLHQSIEPLIIVLQPNTSGSLHLRLSGENLIATMDFVRETWEGFDKVRPFEYSFLDEDLQQLYEDDQQQSQLIALLAYICIFISCIGLLGLASFTMEQRTKEIGIRKVMGASTAQIIILISRNLLTLVLLAAVLASPLAYWYFQSWLENFAYQTDTNPFVFVLATVMALLITFLTVSFHSFQAARSQPISALKYE